MSSSASASPSASPSPEFDYGIKISKEGYDVKSSEITEDVFNSKRGILGKHSTDTITLVTDGDGIINDGESTGLGYTPICFVTVTCYDGTVINVPGSHESSWGRDEILTETFKYFIGENYILFVVKAEHGVPIQGFDPEPLVDQEYTFNIFYCFNELSSEY